MKACYRLTGLLICFTICYFCAMAQDGQSKKEKRAAEEKEKVENQAYLSNEGLNRLLNLKFGSIVTGQSNNTSIGSYASLDPANGSFVFKGSFGVGRKQDSAQISYLTFRLEGGLISDSYAALFTNSKLNTSGLLEGQYHFRLSRSNITYYYSDKARILLVMRMDSIDHDQKIKALMVADSKRSAFLAEQDFLYSFNQTELQINQHRFDSVKADRKIAFDKGDFASVRKLNAVTDSINVLVTKGEATLLQLDKVRDSARFVAKNEIFLRNAQKKIINDAYEQKKMQTELGAPFSMVHLSWLTVIGGISRKDFYTYDTALAFSSRLSTQNLGTFRVGLAYNYYAENSESQRATFINVGFLRYKDNNTSLLSTQTISQESVTKNDAGDTTRKISKQYNAFTDPVVESHVWSIFSNCYFVQKGKGQSFHVYPSVDIYDKGKTLSNIGLGYVVSFKNAKKDQPIINAEGYIQFQDLFNELNKRAGFWNRNEIGVRFTLPFSFF
jgi:hypothetical protein